MSEWIGWNGGECPVHPKTVVEVARRCSDIRHCEAWNIQDSNWIDADEEYSIIAYRVIKEHKEPREFWAFGGKIYAKEEYALRVAKAEGYSEGSLIHVREVTE